MKLPSLRFLLPLFGLIFGFSCNSYTKIPTPEPTLIDQVSILRSTKGDYTFKFANEGEYEVYVGDTPSTIDWSNPHFVAKQSEVSISDLPKNKRLFFGVKGADNLNYIAAERRVSVNSIPNLRDLGGIPTKDGKVTRWGRVYRSGKLSELAKKDMEYFASLDIKTIVDFRDDNEVKKDPNKYPENSDMNYVRVVIGDKEGNLQAALRKQVLENRSNADFDGLAFVVDVNKTFIDDYAYQYTPLMNLLMDERNYPLLFHCSAGKDRTGLAAALILTAVGVDNKLIMDDYLMSNYYRNEHNNKTLRKMTLLGVKQNVAQPLLQVDPSYLQAAYNQMIINHGDIDTFYKKELGIGVEEKASLRAHFLTTGEGEVLN